MVTLGETTVRTSSETQTSRLGRESSELPTGQQVGRYVLLGSVGRGSTGVVYRAYDPELDRRVALKLFPRLDDRGGDRAAALREARALAGLRHGNVVTVYDVGEHDGRVFMAMELVDGRDLADWITAEPRSPVAIVRVLAQAAEGLAAAHDAGIIHRDFKPSNVVVADDGQVFVIDFGLARRGEVSTRPAAGADLLDTDEPSLLGFPAGTPAYLAPELYEGASADPRSDLFAFCVTAWEALFGARPWTAGDELALLEAKRRGAPPLPTQPRIAPEIRSALRAGLQSDPASRPPGLQAILAALRPRRPHRRLRIWGASLGVAVALGVVVGTRQAPCDGAPERTEAVWNDQIKRSMGDALARAEHPHPDQALKRLESNVERYVSRWQSLHLEVCEATHVHLEQSAGLLDRRMACLTRRLEQLDTLLDLLASSGRDEALQGPAAVAKLEAELDCSPADVDPSVGSEPDGARAIRKNLDRIEVLEALAAYEPALELAAETVAAADDLGIVELVQTARYREARLLDRTGDAKRAVKALAEVHWAAEAAGLDGLAAKAGIYVIYLHAAVFKDPDSALAWVPHVRAAVQRAGSDPLDEASLIENTGVAHLYRSEPDEAAEAFEASLRLREEAPGQNGLAIVSSLGNLGVLYEETHRYAEAIDHHHRALAILLTEVGEDHPHTARVLDHLGTAHLRQGDLPSAEEYLGRSLQIRRTALGARHRSVALSSVHLALAALQRDDPDVAIEHYDEALSIYAESLDPAAREILLCHEGLAHARAAKHQWPQAHRHANLALEGLSKVLPAEHPELKGLRSILASGVADPHGVESEVQ